MGLDERGAKVTKSRGRQRSHRINYGERRRQFFTDRRRRRFARERVAQRVDGAVEGEGDTGARKVWD